MAEDQQPARVAALVWGVKHSFRNYVEAAGGATETAAGAERAEDGAFVFAAAPDSDLHLDAAGAPRGTGRFLGEVRFQAHGGMLAVFLADPVLEIGPSGAVLTIADTSARNRRVEVARLDLAAAAPGETGGLALPATILMDGMFWLGDHYPPGTPLDPVRLAPGPS
ncbi:HtaA domain-containing protein [Phenylobacterium sp.]|uniref:HtaA domain-containing protein n=1 Tax=Phenylobacterium sp. TaxID=1871053 RepID=UPI0035B088AC